LDQLGDSEGGGVSSELELRENGSEVVAEQAESVGHVVALSE
jgi:hypothetical protein